MSISPYILLNKLQHVIARNRFAVRLAVKLLNQCRLVIGYHLTPTCHSTENGELLVWTEIAPHVRSFVDVGANVGDWAHEILELTRRRHEVSGLLVEPTPSLAVGLRQRYQDNPRIIIEESALGADVGTATFFVSNHCSEHSSLVMEDASNANSISVKINTLDELLTQHKISDVDLVKIDTEGNDFNVLLGARSFLKRNAIHAIQFEYGNNWKVAGHTLHEAFRYLHSFGYSCHLVTPEGLRVYDLQRYGELFLYSNFLALSSRGRTWLQNLLPSQSDF